MRILFVVLPGCLVWLGLIVGWGTAFAATSESTGSWQSLIAQAKQIGLPTRFLREIDQNFFAVEFADLRGFAAEYHPEQHRMVLNRSLSFNAAGRMIRPLSQLNHRDIATLYHELFHAYFDYLFTKDVQGGNTQLGSRFLAFARRQQECRYSAVMITPLRQRKDAMELRYLSDRESWEALNETWAVFVGWVTWTRLEIQAELSGQSRAGQGKKKNHKILELLKIADGEGELVGYYEPEDLKERAVTHKRYLASASKLSPSEAAVLFEVIMEESSQTASRLTEEMKPSSSNVLGEDCSSEF